MDIRYPERLLLCSALISLLALISVVVVFSGNQRDADSTLKHTALLQSLSGDILLLDERLTASALLASYSGNNQWIERYKVGEIKLTEAITELLDVAETDRIRTLAKAADEANLELVDLEYRSFDLVRANDPDTALSLLMSQSYNENKARYSKVMGQMIELIDDERQQLLARQTKRMSLLLWIVPFCIVLCLAFWTVVHGALRSWRNKFVEEERGRAIAEREVRTLNSELEERIEKRTSQLRRSEQKLSLQANYDELTGLPNRRHIMRHLSERIENEEANSPTTILMVDLDNFKWVNDTMGHATGDDLLIQVANRLRSHLSDQGKVARLGGDEFLIVADSSRFPDSFELADRILQDFARPFRFGEYSYDLPVSPSIGISSFPQHGECVEELIKSADTAMYVAKETGRNKACTFDSAMNEQLDRRLLLESRLRAAVKSSDQFHLLYQPQIDLRSEQVVGAEALLRWVDPNDGLIGPNEFIPIAEDTGLIVEIGQWVLQAAVGQAAKWVKEDGIGFPVSINVASQQLKQHGFHEEVRRALKQHKLKPNLLGIEVTESALVGNDEITLNNLTELDKLGVKLSMDDFGTGYSSLSYLNNLPFDTLKIDRSFIMSIEDKSEDAALVQGIINLSRDINLNVVGEGAETDAQCQLLREYGCDVVQGFYYSRPLAPEDLVAFVDKCRSSSEQARLYGT